MKGPDTSPRLATLQPVRFGFRTLEINMQDCVARQGTGSVINRKWCHKKEEGTLEINNTWTEKEREVQAKKGTETEWETRTVRIRNQKWDKTTMIGVKWRWLSERAVQQDRALCNRQTVTCCRIVCWCIFVWNLSSNEFLLDFKKP